jgi:hypothetical protein
MAPILSRSAWNADVVACVLVGMVRLLAALLVGAGLVAAIATTSAPRAADEPAVSVGRVQGMEAYIAVTYDGKRLWAYACDGSARRPATKSAWFEAPWDGRAPITIVSTGGAKLRVEHVHADGRISGRLGGHRFTVSPATGPAGLVEREGAGWVVLGDGSIRGAMVDPRPRKCRPVQVTLADGTTQIVTVCKTV